VTERARVLIKCQILPGVSYSARERQGLDTVTDTARG
jgi:hypothetical protein